MLLKTIILVVFLFSSCSAAHQLDTLLNNITSLIVNKAATSPGGGSATLIVDNDMKDALTALLYHIERTKRCGENLQKLNQKVARELVPLWSSKFKPELKKVLALTNTLNHLIAAIQSEMLNETSSNNVSPTQLSTSFYSRIVNSNVLTSLGHFLFSNWNDNEPEPEPDDFLGGTAVHKSNRYLRPLPRHIATDSPQNTGSVRSSQFVIGYGVFLKHANHCAFVYRKRSDGTLAKTSSCAHMNLFRKADDSASSNNNNDGQPPFFSANQFEDDGDEYSDVEEDHKHGQGNAAFDESISSINCRNWFFNLERSFNSSAFSLSNTYDKTAFTPEEQQNRLNRYQNYKLVLQRFINLQNMSSSQWCGPYYECHNSSHTYDWLLIYSLPLFESRTHRLLGAVVVKLNLTRLDINQCNSGDPVFANTHKCRPNLECLFAPGKAPFRAGGYWCKCTNNLVGLEGVGTLYDGQDIELHYWLSRSGKPNNYTSSYNCLECSGPNCCLISSYLNTMKERNPAFERGGVGGDAEFTAVKNNMLQCRNYDWTWRYIVLVVQLLVVALVLSLAVLTFLLRQNKVVKQSMWKLLELILLGALLLNITLIIQVFEPSSQSCLAVPWFRELGFSIVYGILNLRLYKLLIEFQSRKAHCVHFKEKDILRSLTIIVGCVLGYLVGWTLVDMDFAANEGFSLLTHTTVKTYIIQFPICKIKWWDYFIEIIEFLFICVGCYLIYCTRSAPSEYNERKFIKLVIYSEAVFSTLLHIIKHSIYTSLHPDYMLLLYFIRCHATVSIMLVLIFVTKMCYIIKAGDYQLTLTGHRADVGGGAVEDAMMGDAAVTKIQLANGHGAVPDVAELSIVDMEPEEIRSELKRLYTQLYIFKSKSVKVDNPHLQKEKKKKEAKKSRRLSNTLLNFTVKVGGDKGAEDKKSSSHSHVSGASIPAHHKVSNVNVTTPNKDNDSVHNRTPDESVCSTEGQGAHSSGGCGTESEHAVTPQPQLLQPRKSNLHLPDPSPGSTESGGGIVARSVQFKS